MSEDERSETNEPETPNAADADVEDPIGDETDGEAQKAIEPEAEEKIEAAEDAGLEEAEIDPEVDGESPAEEDAKADSRPKPPAKLERLQKILAQSGVASRRKAEEMIEQGRVQVNGTIVTDAGNQGRCGARPYPRRREAAAWGGTAALLCAEQAQGFCDHGQGS